MTRTMRFALLGVVATVVGSNVGATTVTATSFSAWKASLTGSPAEANWSSVSFSNYNTSAGIALSAVGNPATQFTFTGPDNGGYQLSGTSYNGFTALEGSADANAGINVALPGVGENAILVVAGSTATSGSPLTLTLSDGEAFTLSNGLFGLALSHPVTSFFLGTTPGSQAVVDDFWFGTSSLTQDNPAPAPEGATLLMVAGGGLILFGARRKFARPAFQL